MSKKAGERVSFTDMDLTLAQNACDDDPVIVLPCSHVFVMSELDGSWRGLVLLNSAHLEPKPCPNCRAPIRGVFRYGRLLAKYFVDVVNKKYLPWVERKIGELEAAVSEATTWKKILAATKKETELDDSARQGGPTGVMVQPALHALDGDVARAAQMGIPANTSSSRLRTRLLLAKAIFKLSALNKDKAAASK